MMTSSQAEGKRIVLATFGSLGDLQPFLAIGAELRARGHLVTVATSGIYRDQVAATSLEFAPVRPDRVVGQQDPDFFDRVMRERRPPAAVFRQMFLPSLRESLQDMLNVLENADAVVSHPLASSARLAAEAYRLPWVSAVMQPMGYVSAHEPPLVGPHWVAAILRLTGSASTRQVLRAARSVTDAWANEWRELRAELGLPAVSDHPLWEGQHSPWRSLGLFPRAIGAPQPDWPAQARVTGFPFFSVPDAALEPELAAFLEAGEPPLVFTLGTTAVNEPGAFFEESASAARALGHRAVLLIGRGNAARCEMFSSNVMTVPFASHELLFPRALAIVHQGGIGTLSEAMRAGKPMLIMPYGHDQADNAWRASRLDVARIISRRRYRGGNVQRKLTEIVDDPGVAAAAQRFAQDISRERGVDSATDLIEAAVGAAAVPGARGTARTCTYTW